MAGDFVPESELNLKGFHKYFNSYTLNGRFNFVVATYGTILGMVILYKLFKPSKAVPKLDGSPARLTDKSGAAGNSGDTNSDSSIPPYCIKAP